MVERKRVGLLFSYNEEWIAGAYYILNIVHALNTINDSRKPILIILSESEDNFKKVVKETGYPYLKFVEYPLKEKQLNVFKRLLNKTFRIILNKNIFNKAKNYPQLDLLYPRELKGLPDNIKKVNWMPDFQEDYLPQFFSEEEIKERKEYQKAIVANGDVVVFSSEDAKKDFIRLYPKAKATSFVLPFAVQHPNFSELSFSKLLHKYKLPETYFFLPNQFWAHKNHIVVLKAIKILKEKGVNVFVAMSGKEMDYRNLNNFKLLKDYIEKHKLDNNVRFLGFIPRKEQLCLFKQAKAIIQPSLFEGWSTVVEDAKVLNKFIILSDLGVHKEQIKNNVHFFDPYNSRLLAQILEKYYINKPKVKNIDYSNDIHKFANKFIDLVNLATVQ